eukprot:m.34306 g.34306  ORF g.34306 m.34306 type:complete len:232 (-) comp11001_c0_seq1:201-896(-)
MTSVEDSPLPASLLYAYGLEITDAASLVRIISFVLSPELFVPFPLEDDDDDSNGDADAEEAHQQGEDGCEYSDSDAEVREPFPGSSNHHRVQSRMSKGQHSNDNGYNRSSLGLPAGNLRDYEDLASTQARVRVLHALLQAKTLTDVVAVLRREIPAFPLLSRRYLDGVDPAHYFLIDSNVQLQPWAYAPHTFYLAHSLIAERATASSSSAKAEMTTASPTIWQMVVASSFK